MDSGLDNLASLKLLYLGGNQLSELPDGVFDNLTELEELYLEVNELSELPDGVFDNLIRLERLGLSHNELSELPDGVFDNVTELWSLDLKYNQLSALPEGIFGNLTGLRELHLFSNKLSELPDDTFLGLTNLHAMDFHLNTGSPFILTAELEQTGENTIALKVAQGTPVDMEVTLAAEGGALSSTVVVIAAGSVSSGPVTVHPDGGEPVTISVVSANIPRPTNNRIIGIQIGLGDPLTVEQVSITNTPATGAPTISGTIRVGETLRTDTSDIEDANGLANATFSYRWVSSDGTTDTDIENATDSTYKLVAADQGKSIKVIVTFADDAGNEETLASAPAGPVVEEPVWGDGPPGAPRNLTISAGDQEITLSWEPPADNGNAPAKRYRIEFRIDGKDYKKGQWGTSRSTTYTKTDLANGVKYVFRVKAENGNGNSYGPYGPASEEVSATPTSGSAVDLGTPVLSNTKTLHRGSAVPIEEARDSESYTCVACNKPVSVVTDETPPYYRHSEVDHDQGCDDALALHRVAVYFIKRGIESGGYEVQTQCPREKRRAGTGWDCEPIVLDLGTDCVGVEPRQRLLPVTDSDLVCRYSSGDPVVIEVVNQRRPLPEVEAAYRELGYLVFLVDPTWEKVEALKTRIEGAEAWNGLCRRCATWEKWARAWVRGEPWAVAWVKDR